MLPLVSERHLLWLIIHRFGLSPSTCKGRLVRYYIAGLAQIVCKYGWLRPFLVEASRH